MTGNINWKATIDSFKKIGYNGIFSVEYAYGKLPEHLMEQFIEE
jgi:sugar phosphate isomerase/epimerase